MTSTHSPASRHRRLIVRVAQAALAGLLAGGCLQAASGTSAAGAERREAQADSAALLRAVEAVQRERPMVPPASAERPTTVVIVALAGDSARVRESRYNGCAPGEGGTFYGPERLLRFRRTSTGWVLVDEADAHYVHGRCVRSSGGAT